MHHKGVRGTHKINHLTTSINGYRLGSTRTLHAIQEAEKGAAPTQPKERQKAPPSACVDLTIRNFECIQEASATSKNIRAAPEELNIRARQQYNCRHTYATMCLMAGMKPAFIANQLGRSVQMLLSTYARWISSSMGWNVLGKRESS
ncbi:hypothetical protein D3C77_254200 [compost metagenome]